MSDQKHIERVCMKKVEHLLAWWYSEGKKSFPVWYECVQAWLAGDERVKGHGLCSDERQVIQGWLTNTILR